MKTLFAAIPLILLAVSCGPKTTAPVTIYTPGTTTTPGTTIVSDCPDSLAQMVFVNKRTVELRVNISSKTSVKEGNTIINTWKTFNTLVIPLGDSATAKLKSGQQFMYTVMGPVSVNVSGLGVIAEEKFTLKLCERRRQEL